MVKIDPEAPVTIYDYVALKEYIASLFNEPVDIVDREGLKPHLRLNATTDAVYAF